MPTEMAATPGWRNGATIDQDGCRFQLWAPAASRVQLTLLDSVGTQLATDMVRSGEHWRLFVPGVGAGRYYGFRVHGEWDPSRGLRANPAKLLLDPYARAITGGVHHDGPIRDHGSNLPAWADTRDSVGHVPWSVVVADSPPPRPIARRRPMNQSVIYELHVKGFTQQHPKVPVHLRGSYLGLACKPVIEHLKRMGVTAVELLPVQEFLSEQFIAAKGLSNYWGYNPIGFFAPHGAYSATGTTGAQVEEFKAMVSALHAADIEVICDVVYNHTAESSHHGPTLSFRGIDQAGFYRLDGDAHHDVDVTGCGNSVDTSNPATLNFILDSLRYWVQEMGVDGFRFDLATVLIRNEHHGVDRNHCFLEAVATDPILSRVKMIAEPWDIGIDGYQLGGFGRGWSEWNDKYRNLVRDFWLGTGGIQELATRLTASADVFGHSDRPPSASINFVTAHDGFTVRDLVSHEYKHNWANGELNRDGSDDNRSTNCGVEGDTDDPSINALRHRQVRNLLGTLLVSRGVPMLLGGDELGRTQLGNNNAYCQDNQSSWVDWIGGESWQDVQELVHSLTQLRTDNPLFTHDDYLYRVEVTDERGRFLGRYNLAWMNGGSGEMTDADWTDPTRRLIGMYLSDRYRALLVWFHAGHQSVQVTMPPAPWGSHYEVIATTAEPGELPRTRLCPEETLSLPHRSLTVMGVEVITHASGLKRLPPALRKNRGDIPAHPTILGVSGHGSR